MKEISEIIDAWKALCAKQDEVFVPVITPGYADLTRDMKLPLWPDGPRGTPVTGGVVIPAGEFLTHLNKLSETL